LVCRLGLVARKTIGVLLCGVNLRLSREIGENLGRSTDQKYRYADLEKDPDHNDNVAAKEGFSDIGICTRTSSPGSSKPLSAGTGWEKAENSGKSRAVVRGGKRATG
jgi:hypothetical protein